jgi:ribonuclease G
MSKEMIISVNGREKKIAIIEDDVVTEFYVERGDENQGIVGNIYKGRVMKVLPGMQSAFVDIGLERDSFLYVSDFFDEEEVDDDDDVAEEKKGSPRQQQRQPQRAQREVARAAEREEEDDKDVDFQIVLSHIEELSEEPVIEPAPDDDVLDAELAESAEESEAPLSPRQRRQRRMRYAEREKKEELPVEESAESDTDEESSGRRRRRPRRRRGAETAETEPVVEIDADSGEVEVGFYTPYIVVHHEPLERITDDDLSGTEGDMLKDAMVQERIFGRIHDDERRTSLIDVEPTPEVRVGSLHSEIESQSDFERVSDGSEARSANRAAAKRGKLGYPFDVDIDDPSDDRSSNEVAADEPGEEASDETEAAESEGIRVVQFEEPSSNGTDADSAEESDGEVLTDNSDAAGEELSDASAEIRQRPRRGEMVTRRGGRGRRRGYRSRSSAAAQPAADNKKESGDGDAPAHKESSPPPSRQDRPSRPVITDLLREGQEIIVQIAKEPIGQKGARITSHIALPGRYIVYMPTVEHIGVSRKIGTDEERHRLKRTLHQLRGEAGVGGGFIVRTAANGCTLEELREDMQYLIRTWTEIRRRADRGKAPSIAHRDLDLEQRILRDQLSSEFSAIRVDNEFEYERIVDFVNRFAPKLVNRVKLYTKETPILDYYGVQSEIDKAVKPRVWLRSGGYIVINQTEALVAIDVNTGKFVGKSNRLEDTIVKTNLEAAKEIVRQIRLRDLGGIIVLDFIDMEERKNRQKVMQALEHELRSDRSPSKILQFNDFGLVAITRKRVKQSLERTICTPCSYCGGGGMVKSPQTMSYEILAESRRISKDVDHHNEVILRVNPEVAKALRSSERDVMAEIESYLGGVVTIKSDPTVHQEQFDIALV